MLLYRITRQTLGNLRRLKRGMGMGKGKESGVGRGVGRVRGEGVEVILGV